MLLALLPACSKDSSGPARHDPTVLIVNHATSDPYAAAGDTLYFTWRDGQGITGSVVVAPGRQSCTRFLAQADSAYFEAVSTNGAGTSHYTQPWFNPSSRPAWTMEINAGVGSSPAIVVSDVANEPC